MTRSARHGLGVPPLMRVFGCGNTLRSKGQKFLKSINDIRATEDWPPAVIAGAFQTGVLGVRSLKRHGVNAWSFDCNAAMPGFRSAYGPSKLCPNPDERPEEWLAFMIRLAREIGRKSVLIPSSDRYVTAIARNHEALRENYLISPGIKLQGLLAQKHTQYQLAMDNGMPMPVTGMIGSLDQLIEYSSTLSYPCLIKPWHFREWERFPEGHPLSYQKISIANTQQELFDAYKLAREANPRVIVQDIIQGGDTDKRVYLAVYDKNSKRIANAMFRELRCVPLGFGPASVSEPVIDDEADRVCNDFLTRIGYVGICEIEAKRDSRDGKVKLIEANPRLSGGGDAAPYSGVDICWIHYLDMIGHEVDPVVPNGKHFKHIVLRAEGTAIPEYMKAGLLTWGGLLESYKPPLAFYDFDIRDWRNSLETLLVAGKLLVRGMLAGSRG